MPNPADVARDRIAALKAEISELEAFLQLYYRLAGSPDTAIAASSQALIMPASVGGQGNVTLQNDRKHPVENPAKKPRKKRSDLRPDAMAEHMARIIREVGQPMTRGDIVEALERRDIHIPFEDKGRYIGTIAWRHKGTFENIEGRGYWLRGEPIPDDPRIAGLHVEGFQL
jgi:hypothetical protein